MKGRTTADKLSAKASGHTQVFYRQRFPRSGHTLRRTTINVNHASVCT